MSNYRRTFYSGGTFFFTVTLADRRSEILLEHIDHLRLVYRRVQERYPFRTIAICILPDHIHAVWQLPEGDIDYPLRWNLIKSGFSRRVPHKRSLSRSKMNHREKGIWQRRYWEHRIRNNTDLEAHIDYIHFNPVKHGLTAHVIDWPWSTFHRFVDRGLLPKDWAGDKVNCNGNYGE